MKRTWNEWDDRSGEGEHWGSGVFNPDARFQPHVDTQLTGSGPELQRVSSENPRRILLSDFGPLESELRPLTERSREFEASHIA